MSHMRAIQALIVPSTLTLSLLALPTIAGAQITGRVPARSVTPHVGMYIPVGSLVASDALRLRPVASIALGSRVAIPLSPSWALEGGLTWSPNLVAQSDWRETIDLEGGVLFSSARARVRLNRVTSRSQVVASFSSGVGIVHRYGDAWASMSGMTDAALVFAAGLRYVEIGSRLSFTVDVENFITHTGYTDSMGEHLGGNLQNDVLVSFGVAIDLRSTWRD